MAQKFGVTRIEGWGQENVSQSEGLGQFLQGRVGNYHQVKINDA